MFHSILLRRLPLGTCPLTTRALTSTKLFDDNPVNSLRTSILASALSAPGGVQSDGPDAGVGPPPAFRVHPDSPLMSYGFTDKTLAVAGLNVGSGCHVGPALLSPEGLVHHLLSRWNDSLEAFYLDDPREDESTAERVRRGMRHRILEQLVHALPVYAGAMAVGAGAVPASGTVDPHLVSLPAAGRTAEHLHGTVQMLCWPRGRPVSPGGFPGPEWRTEAAVGALLAAAELHAVAGFERGGDAATAVASTEDFVNGRLEVLGNFLDGANHPNHPPAYGGGMTPAVAMDAAAAVVSSLGSAAAGMALDVARGAVGGAVGVAAKMAVSDATIATTGMSHGGGPIRKPSPSAAMARCPADAQVDEKEWVEANLPPFPGEEMEQNAAQKGAA